MTIDEFKECDGMEGTFESLNMYLVSFQVDTGVDHVISNAVVFAMDETDAINMIKKHISERCSEDSVEEVFFCRPFVGLLFTEKFGWR